MAGEAESPLADELRQLIAEVSAGRAEAATLLRFVRESYLFHAELLARPSDHGRYLPNSSRSEVAARVWLEATGSRTSPPAAKRSKPETTIGQYISRFARIATDPYRGLASIENDESYAQAMADIAQIQKGRNAQLNEMLFEVFSSSLTPEEQAAMVSVRAVVTRHPQLRAQIIKSLERDIEESVSE